MMRERKLLVQRLGLVDYESALALQKQTEQAVKTGAQPDTLLLLEHPHTLTIGRRGDSSSVLLDEEELKQRSVTLFETNRGGKVTYHGLGQVVGYPIINLSPDREDVHRYVRDLEEVLIRTLSDFGIEAFRIEGLTGVHTRRGKVAAIGVHIARWVTTHGFALNVNTDLSYFDLIIACDGEPVTSMEELLTGLPIPGGAKNRQILRRSAARDPLTLEGEWRFIGPRTQALVEFQQSIFFYTGSFVPSPTVPQIVTLQQFAVPPMASAIHIGEKPESSSSSSADDVSSGPFVGVASRSKRDSVLTYYGIERENQWIFTPLFR